MNNAIEIQQYFGLSNFAERKWITSAWHETENNIHLSSASESIEERKMNGLQNLDVCIA